MKTWHVIAIYIGVFLIYIVIWGAMIYGAVKLVKWAWGA